MKSSEILREAAALAHTEPYDRHEWRGGCTAIYDIYDIADFDHDDAAMAFFRLFRPHDAYLTYWFGSVARDHPDALEIKEHRVLALCLAAAIAESEGD